ncbi:hypothetical protein KKA14_21530, partial [bacterium]|nr:hypothetical protein [bacterium]
GFEDIQAKQTEISKKLDALDLDLLNQEKQKKQINVEEVTIEEMASRYKDSRKRLIDTLKNTEKGLQKDTKAVVDLETKINGINAEKAELREKQQKLLRDTKEKLERLGSMEVRASVLTHVLTLLITSSQQRKEAWQKVLDGFKQRLIADLKLAQNRVDEIKKVSQKKLREMGKKASKLQRLKQDMAVKEFQEEIAKYRNSVDSKCAQILAYTKQEAALQKQRIIHMFHEISKEKKKNDALPARQLIDLISRMGDGQKFTTEFTDFLIQSIARKYQKNLQPLYANVFDVLKPTLLSKVSLIQALRKNSDAAGIHLELTDEEQNSFNGIVTGVKNKLRKLEPDIFNYTVKIQTTTVAIDTLLNISIDNPSLRLILSMKVSSPENPKTVQLNPSLIKKILELNHIITPVPTNDLLLEGKGNEKDPLSVVNTTLLKKLIMENEQARKKEVRAVS